MYAVVYLSQINDKRLSKTILLSHEASPNGFHFHVTKNIGAGRLKPKRTRRSGRRRPKSLGAYWIISSKNKGWP